MSVEVIAAISVGAAASFIGEYFKKKKKSKETPDLNIRVIELTKSLSQSTSLIAEIQEDIERRHDLVKKLKNDTEHYETLSKLKEKETEAVAQLFKGIVSNDSKNSFYKGVLVNFIFFVMGVGASYAISQII